MRQVWLAAALVSAACTAAPDTKAVPADARPAAPTPQATAPSATGVRVAHQPPTAKDVIDAAMASSHLPLKNAANCANSGTELSDATIGRYLAGFLAELSAPNKKNWIETKIAPGQSPTGEAVSICTLIVRHEDGDDRWGWGVQFQVRSSDGLVLESSFSCVGSG
jgi:hypothetical protein